MTETNVMKVFIDRCTVNLLVGVRDHEKTKPQRVIVTVEAEAPLVKPFRDTANADLTAVVDYSPLRDFIVQKLPQKGCIPLLETVAQHIVDFCLSSDPRIQKVRVRLEKPDIYPDCESAGVALTVTRPGDIEP